MANDIMTFKTLDEAIAWGEENFESKYDNALIKVGDRYVWLCCTAMVEDETLRADIETAIETFLDTIGFTGKFSNSDIAMDMGAELTGDAYEYLSKYDNLDVEFVYDTF